MRCELLSTACDQAPTSQVAYAIYLLSEHACIDTHKWIDSFFWPLYASLLQSFVPVALIVISIYFPMSVKYFSKKLPSSLN